MFQEKRCVTAVRIAVGLLAGVVSFGAQAQSATEEGKVQRIEITGSNIKRMNSETPSAVQVISKKEILQSGATTVAELMDKVTANTQSLTDRDPTGGSFAAGGSAMNLRGLGPAYTLVLVNGRRVSPFALAEGAQVNFTNIDTIPVDLIERVEILKDGASAIYGSDAIAGVVNIITTKEFQGFAIKGSAQGNTLNKKMDRSEEASITFGYGDLSVQNFNVMGNIEVYRRHDYTAQDTMKNVPAWYKQYVNRDFGNWTTYSSPGNILNFDPNTGAPFFQADPSCPKSNLIDGACRYNSYARTNSLPTSDRVNLTLGGRYNINDTTQAFFDANYSQNKSTIISNPFVMGWGGAMSWFDPRSKAVKTYYDPMLPPGHAKNPFPFPAIYQYSFNDELESWKTELTNSQYRVLAGLEGSVAGWDYNTAVGVLGAKAERRQRYWPNSDNLSRAIESGEYKFGATNSSALLASMFPIVKTNGNTRTYFIDGRASRELFKLDGGQLAIATGFEYRRFDFRMNTDEQTNRAEIVGSTPINIGGVHNQYAVYGELSAPVRKDLELIAALRADKSGTAELSVVPKIGAKYVVGPAAMVRATYSQGFRAPNASESAPGGSISGYLNGLVDPKRCGTASAIEQILMNSPNEQDRIFARDARQSGCAISAAGLTASNPALKPEKSTSFTLGAVFEPIKNFNFIVDYFRIERRNEIGILDANEVLTKEDLLPGIIGRQAISPRDKQLSERAKQLNPKATGVDFLVGQVATISLDYLNLYRTKVSGIDVEANYRFNLGDAGRFNLGLDYSYSLDYSRWDSLKNAYGENVVGNYGNPRYKGTLKLSWDKAAWSVGARVNFKAGTQLASSQLYDTFWSVEGCKSRENPAEICYLGTDETIDLSVSYAGFKNTRIFFNAQNAFNRSSVIDIRSGAALRGRIVKIGAEYRF